MRPSGPSHGPWPPSSWPLAKPPYPAAPTHARFVLIGFGAVAQGLLPLLVHALGVSPQRISAWAKDNTGAAVARAWGVTFRCQPITPDNFSPLLDAALKPGDVLLNLAVEVSSLALLAWCQQAGVHYLDTCIEPWAGGYHISQDSRQNSSQAGHSSVPAPTTNHALRRAALALRQPGKATAVLAHGANPGLVSHFVKRALHNMAQDLGLAAASQPTAPCAYTALAELAERLGVHVIQVAERDTQNLPPQPAAPQAFCNTWSVPGFLSELGQACEAGWGSHEPRLPTGASWAAGEHACSIAWPQPPTGLQRVKTWVPSAGAGWAWLVTHHESISLAEHLSLRHPDGSLRYRPTVYYAYQPSPPTQSAIARWLAQGKAWPRQQQLLMAQLHSGHDELGVLLCHARGAYWYGSHLGLDQARALAPHNNATTLQVAAGILGALVWLFAHPRAGIVEAEDLDSELVLAAALPFLGTVGGTHTPWQAGADLCFCAFTPPDSP